MENTQETLNELRRLRIKSSMSLMPNIAEDPEIPIAQHLRSNSSSEMTTASKLDPVANELNDFSRVLKQERDLFCRHLSEAGIMDSAAFEEGEEDPMEMNVKLLQAILQDVEQQLERARNSSKREYNQQVVRQPHKQATIDSGITSPFLTSPTIYAHSNDQLPRPFHRTLSDESFLASGEGLRPFQSWPSPATSPLLASSPPTTSVMGIGTSTGVTTPMLTSPHWNPQTGTRPPSLRLPDAASDWSTFCEEVEISCAGWQKAWKCKLSYYQRSGDGGLSLRAERSDGCCLSHDIPALGMTVPHTSHTGANPQARNMVKFLDSHDHLVKKVTRHEENRERDPKYIFRNPTDHKAFQKLIYGFELECSWDINSIESDREKESVTQTLRLWRDTHTQMLLILFYTNNRKRSTKVYIQEPSKQRLSSMKPCIANHYCTEDSFTDKLKTEKKKPTVQLYFSDHKIDQGHKSATSINSSHLSIKSDRSGRSSTNKVPHLQWIIVDFASLDDRDHFVNLWRS